MSLPPIVRYPAFGPSLWGYEKLPDGATVEPVPLVAEDAGESHGMLHSRGGERIVVMVMHPRADFQRHYAMPYLLEAGIAAWGQAGRFVNNDVNCIKERLLLDVAAGVRHLRERGFEKIVVLGNSGGGALYSLYQAQAETTPPSRLTETAAGDPCDLNDFELPLADGIMMLATHQGEGKFMNVILDPSVTDENDPTSVDSSLDMYDRENGFCPLPEPSTYSAEFLERYRAGQRARGARIDAIARGHIGEQRHYLKRVGAPDFESLSFEEQQWCLRRGLLGRYMEIHRTEAYPAFTDPSIHPNERMIGSFFSPRPDIFNYMEAGFGKYMTPRAWLSTWSGHVSLFSTLDAIAQVTVPTLVVAYTGDNVVLPCDTDGVYDASAASDKEIHRVKGDHIGWGPADLQDKGGQREAAGKLCDWLHSRF